MVCPSCGFANDPASTTCAHCAAALTGPPSHNPGFGVFEPPPRSRRRVIGILAIVVTVLALAGTGYVILTRRDTPAPGPAAGPATTTGGGPTRADPPTSAADQAGVVNSVLNQSVRSRAKLNQSIDRVQQCTRLGAAVADMKAVGAERQAQLTTIDSATLDKLPKAEQLRSTLHDALGFALAADQGYLAWATPTPAEGCADTPARTAAFDRGQAASDKAGAAKTSFLKLWNPVAADLGLPKRTRETI